MWPVRFLKTVDRVQQLKVLTLLLFTFSVLTVGSPTIYIFICFLSLIFSCCFAQNWGGYGCHLQGAVWYPWRTRERRFSLLFVLSVCAFVYNLAKRLPLHAPQTWLFHGCLVHGTTWPSSSSSSSLLSPKGPDPPSSTVICQWNKIFSCYGSRQDFDSTIIQCLVSDDNSAC